VALRVWDICLLTMAGGLAPQKIAYLRLLQRHRLNRAKTAPPQRRAYGGVSPGVNAMATTCVWRRAAMMLARSGGMAAAVLLFSVFRRTAISAERGGRQLRGGKQALRGALALRRCGCRRAKRRAENRAAGCLVSFCGAAVQSVNTARAGTPFTKTIVAWRRAGGSAAARPPSADAHLMANGRLPAARYLAKALVRCRIIAVVICPPTVWRAAAAAAENACAPRQRTDRHGTRQTLPARVASRMTPACV